MGKLQRCGAPNVVAIVRTEYGTFAMCEVCLRANHMRVRNPSPVWRG